MSVKRSKRTKSSSLRNQSKGQIQLEINRKIWISIERTFAVKKARKVLASNAIDKSHKNNSCENSGTIED